MKIVGVPAWWFLLIDDDIDPGVGFVFIGVVFEVVDEFLGVLCAYASNGLVGFLLFDG